MRQINTSGYMHNRLRMVAASFLVKDLHVDWRFGERYFADHLNDFDLAAKSTLEQQACGVLIGRDYPPPIVDHDRARLGALELFGKVGRGERAQVSKT